MTNRVQPERSQRETEAAQAQEKEGHGMVPNTPTGQPQTEAEQLKAAAHELEEEKGDWGKDR